MSSKLIKKDPWSLYKLYLPYGCQIACMRHEFSIHLFGNASNVVRFKKWTRGSNFIPHDVLHRNLQHASPTLRRRVTLQETNIFPLR